ncbi:MAG: DUF2201 family putative metallopeptidase [Desulfovibrionales bacterium]
MVNPLDRLRKARTSLILNAPFFGTLALRLVLKEDSSCETVWTDGKVLGANPEFLAKTGRDLLEGILCHEVMHLAMGHHLRRKGRDKDLWNQAADIAINPVVEDAGFSLPRSRLRDESLEDMEAEEVYRILKQRRRKGAGIADASQQKSMRPCENTDRRPGSRPSDSTPKGSEKDVPAAFGEIRDYPARDGKDRRRQQAEWANAVREAVIASRAWGRMPGKLRRMLNRFGPAQVNWRESLRRFVEETSRNDYSWKTPNRRYLPLGFYLPVLENKEFGKIVLIVDTSSSLSRDDLSRLCTECLSILELYNEDASITVLYVDSTLAGVQELRRKNSPLPVGGGGTSYKPGFAWIEEQDWMPAAVVYFTDGHCADFPQEPDVPVLWILSSENQWFEKRVPFGEVLLLA